MIQKGSWIAVVGLQYHLVQHFSAGAALVDIVVVPDSVDADGIAVKNPKNHNSDDLLHLSQRRTLWCY